jgi:hypothetical protein
MPDENLRSLPSLKAAMSSWSRRKTGLIDFAWLLHIGICATHHGGPDIQPVLRVPRCMVIGRICTRWMDPTHQISVVPQPLKVAVGVKPCLFVDIIIKEPLNFCSMQATAILVLNTHQQPLHQVKACRMFRRVYTHGRLGVFPGID